MLDTGTTVTPFVDSPRDLTPNAGQASSLAPQPRRCARGARIIMQEEPKQLVQQADSLVSHIWMVRTFLKHSEEAEEDEQLRQVHRALYDYALALGGPLQSGDAESYLKMARKKYGKLRRATELFLQIQPDVSTHTNFRMAAQSLQAAVSQLGQLLGIDQN